jgi:membrane protein
VDYDDEPAVIIERHSGGTGSFLLGVAIGAVAALLLAPQSGEETRRDLRRGARRARRAAKDMAGDLTTKVGDTFDQARDRVEQGIDTARQAIDLKKRQVTRAMEAGRAAAQQARDELERRIAETKAAYNAGVDVARTSKAASLPTRGGPRRVARALTEIVGTPLRVPRRPVYIRVAWTLRDYVKRVWDNSGEDNIFFLAGGIAFNILLAIVPFVLLLVSGLATLLNHSADQTFADVTSIIDSLLPPHAETSGSPVHMLLIDVIRARGAVGLYSAVGFVWFSTRLFGSLRSVLADVFDIETDRGIIAGKLFDIQITIMATLLLVAYTALSAYLALATTRGVQIFERLGIRADVMGTLEYAFGRSIAFVFVAAMFFALYKFLPNRKIRWRRRCSRRCSRAACSRSRKRVHSVRRRVQSGLDLHGHALRAHHRRDLGILRRDDLHSWRRGGAGV